MRVPTTARQCAHDDARRLRLSVGLVALLGSAAGLRSRCRRRCIMLAAARRLAAGPRGPAPSLRVYCSSGARDDRLAARFSELVNLADDGLGATVLFATDEWFATADNLLKPTPPLFDPEAFCSQGKVMDGWESRRRRLAGHDWSIIRLGVAGFVHGVEIDTAHFTGNQTPAAVVLAATIDGDDDAAWLGTPRATLGVQGSACTPEEIEAAAAAVDAAATWVELVPMSPLRPGYSAATGYADAGEQSVHRFVVPPAAAGRRVTHLRLNQHPDGGIARMRAWGVVARDFETELAGAAVGRIDLLSALNGGRAVGCSDKHYGEPRNLLRPGRGANMGEGWETARNPRRPYVIAKDAAGMVDMPGAEDWAVLRLAAVAGSIDELVIDTHHFKGNYPESVKVEACDAPGAASGDLLDDSAASPIAWRPLLPRVQLGPDAIHTFGKAELASAGRVSHVRVTILPDGGIMRVRAIGEAVAPMPDEPPTAA